LLLLLLRTALSHAANAVFLSSASSGHDHAYMRTHPLAFNQTDETGKAPVYLTLGAGGNHEGHPQGYRNAEQEPWVAKRTMQDFGYGNLFLANATHARLQWVRDRTTNTDFQDIVWFENAHVQMVE
jgi:Iron/zinc purple acid phosphatase-like protein C